MNPWRLQELTLTETKKKYKIAILPIGSTEAHGYHVPYGSDALHSTAIAERICSEAWKKGSRVLLMPTIPYGVQGNTMGFPLTINVQQRTLDSFLIDVVESLEHHGVTKLLIINGHGGNDFKPLLRSLHGKTRVFVCLADWWKVGNDALGKIFETVGEHADELETSVDLALFGDRVHLENAGAGSVRRSRFEAINKGWVSIARPWHLLTKDSTAGDPRKATKAKGEAYVQLVVDRLTAYVIDLARNRIDARFPY
jgi:creatinine amidohydrolase